MNIENPITRADIYEREEGEVVRLFSKRKLMGEFDADDVARESDNWLFDFNEWLKAGQRSLTEAMDWLGESGEEEDEEERESGSVVPQKYREIYGAAQNCGDEIALALTEHVTLGRATKKNPDGGLDRARLRAVAEINGIGDRLAQWEDRGLNGGLLRMNTSNVLRGMNRRGLRVEIGDKVWPAREVPKKTRAKKAVEA